MKPVYSHLVLGLFAMALLRRIAVATDSFPLRHACHLARVGAKHDLLQYCGEPSERRDGDTWVYDRGPERQVDGRDHFDIHMKIDRIQAQ